MIRIFDITFSILGLLISLPILLTTYIIIRFYTDSPIFRQKRIGINQISFTLIKFRTMKPNTTSIATHLISKNAVTPLGHFLRRSKLDELPQLWNVLKGDMSLVGPRPCLPNQTRLRQERAKRNIFNVRPGITGLAQIKGIDMSSPKTLAITDEKMLKTLNVRNYLSYIVQTIFGKGRGDNIIIKAKKTKL